MRPIRSDSAAPRRGELLTGVDGLKLLASRNAGQKDRVIPACTGERDRAIVGLGGLEFLVQELELYVVDQAPARLQTDDLEAEECSTGTPVDPLHLHRTDPLRVQLHVLDLDRGFRIDHEDFHPLCPSWQTQNSTFRAILSSVCIERLDRSISQSIH